ELVPVGDSCRLHREHDLVRRRRPGRLQLEQAHLAAERVDAGGLHPSHHHPLRGSSPGCIVPVMEMVPTRFWESPSDLEAWRLRELPCSLIRRAGSRWDLPTPWISSTRASATPTRSPT